VIRTTHGDTDSASDHNDRRNLAGNELLVASLPRVVRKLDKNGSQKSKRKKSVGFAKVFDLSKWKESARFAQCRGQRPSFLTRKKPHKINDGEIKDSCGLKVAPRKEKPDV